MLVEMQWKKLTKKCHPKLWQECWTWDGKEVWKDQWCTLHDKYNKRLPDSFYQDNITHWMPIYKPEPPVQ